MILTNLCSECDPDIVEKLGVLTATFPVSRTFRSDLRMAVRVFRDMSSYWGLIGILRAGNP